MNRKVMKTLSTILMILMVVSTVIPVFATEEGQPSLEGPAVLSPPMKAEGVSMLKSAGGSLLTILKTIGIVLSLVIIMVIGIKYMLGSAEEKSEYKKSLLPYVIGAALIFAASFFAGGIYDFFNGIGGSSTPSGGRYIV